jgi:hypothetical protein
MPARAARAKRRKARHVSSLARAARVLFPRSFLRDRAFLPCKSFVLRAGGPAFSGTAEALSSPQFLRFPCRTRTAGVRHVDCG